MAYFRVGMSALVMLVVSSTLVGPNVFAQTREEVDEAHDELHEAEADLEAALAEKDFVETELEAAIKDYQTVNAELADMTYRISLLRERMEDAESQVAALRDDARTHLIQAYMVGGSGTLDVFFESETFDQLVTSQHVLEQAAARSIAEADRLAAVRREIVLLQDALDGERETERVLADQAAEAAEALQVLADRAAELADEADRLLAEASAEYRTAVAALEAEKRRRRLAELARLEGAAAGVPLELTPGFVCPVAGPHSFINDWGFPRSGGRTHKGTDMFASRGTQLVAVADGTVSIANRGLGGKIVWLSADYGVSYYYAHLDGWPSGLKSGDRVSKGQVVGFVGNSGNAAGGSTHVHFQIHPGGRGTAAVNPYPTLVRGTCR